jgi:hypothetical protein
MPELTCFRLLDAESPAGPLAEAVRQVNVGQGGAAVFLLDSKSFNQVEDAPFSYWLSPREFELFSSSQQLEGPGRQIRQGLASADDFRYVRCMWEVPKNSANRWLPFAKGGSHSNFYAEHYLRVNWSLNGNEMKASDGAVIRNDAFYLQPGLTWSDRTTKDFSVRVWPAGGVFSTKGSAGFFGLDNIYALGLMNSPTFNQLLSAMVGAADMAAKSYQVGTISRVPFLIPSEDAKRQVEALSLAGWQARRAVFILQETSNYFTKPFTSLPTDLGSLVKSNSEVVEKSKSDVQKHRRDIDRVIRALYKLPCLDECSDREMAAPDSEPDSFPEQLDVASEAARIVSYAVGVVFGRWNLDLALSGSTILPDDPFAPLPPAPLGMATFDKNACRLYMTSDDEVSLYEVTSKVLARIFSKQNNQFEQAAATALGFKSLVDYLAQQSGFFTDHLAAYSKSRRLAPIYWPLSTRSGDFVIWVHYPMMDADSLPRLITEVLDPRLRRIDEELAGLAADGKAGSRKDKLKALRLEMSEMRQDFQELIAKGYKPDLNDGVLLTACPLAKYFRHAGFRAKLESCWRELARGDYDWSHLAMSMWPERVVAACKQDRSIAIAHGREDLCPSEPPKATRGRKKKAD